MHSNPGSATHPSLCELQGNGGVCFPHLSSNTLWMWQYSTVCVALPRRCLRVLFIIKAVWVFFLYGETCLSLLLLYFLGRSLFHLFCSFDLSLSTSRKGFEVHYFAIHSMRGGRVNLRHVVYSKPGKKHSNCLSALAPSLPLKILD